MNKERLLKLADFLDTVPAEKFDLRTWQCGTTACAVGWACTMPEFQDEGLVLANRWPDFIPFPMYIGYTCWTAVKQFFELTSVNADHLFDAGEYEPGATPQDVAVRIRRVVAEDSIVKGEYPK